MYKKCKTLASSERQKQFEQTLLNLMEKQTFKEITVSALCREMGVPRKAFYRYFDSVEDVLYALMDEILQAAFLHMEVRLELEKFFRYWREKKGLLDVLEKNGLSQKLMDRSYTLIMTSEKLEAMTAKEMMYAGYVSAILTLVIMWHHTGMCQSPEEMKELAGRMFISNSEN